VTFVHISAMRADVCRKFYVTVEQDKTHLIDKYCWNMFENDKIMLFQPRQPLFLSFCLHQ